MIQLSVSSTAACDSLQISRPPFLTRNLHLDFGVIEWLKNIDIWGTQNERKTFALHLRTPTAPHKQQQPAKSRHAP